MQRFIITAVLGIFPAGQEVTSGGTAAISIEAGAQSLDDGPTIKTPPLVADATRTELRRTTPHSQQHAARRQMLGELDGEHRARGVRRGRQRDGDVRRQLGDPEVLRDDLAERQDGHGQDQIGDEGKGDQADGRRVAIGQRPFARHDRSVRRPRGQGSGVRAGGRPLAVLQVGGSSGHEGTSTSAKSGSDLRQQSPTRMSNSNLRHGRPAAMSAPIPVMQRRGRPDRGCAAAGKQRGDAVAHRCGRPAPRAAHRAVPGGEDKAVPVRNVVAVPRDWARGRCSTCRNSPPV